MKARGVLRDEHLSIISQSLGDETVTLARSEAVTGSEPGNLTNLPPLQPDDMKILYTQFKEGKSPAEVIAINGFSPTLVEYEYSSFCRMNGLDPKLLLQNLVEALRSSNPELSSRLSQKIDQEGITCNRDIQNFFEYALNSSHSMGQSSVVQHMLNGGSIENYKPFLCSVCSKPMVGALFDLESEIGMQILEAGAEAMHNDCMSRCTLKVRD